MKSDWLNKYDYNTLVLPVALYGKECKDEITTSTNEFLRRIKE